MTDHTVMHAPKPGVDMRPAGGVVDFDTHFWQPIEIWEKYIDDAHRGQIKDYLQTAELIPSAAKARAAVAMQIKGGDDPHTRLEWMDEEGIDACIIYPSMMAQLCYLPDSALASAAARALNRWAAEFASGAPDRLFPCAVLPWYDPDLARAELERARSLRFRLAFTTPTPSRVRRWSDRAYDPLWSELVDAGMTLTMHEFTRLPGDSAQVTARDSYKDSYAMMYLCGHTVEAQLSLMDLAFGGVFGRFPDLRVGFVEAHVAWLPGWLAMLDNQWPRVEANTPDFADWGSLDEPPSALFRRQCYIVAFPDDPWIDEVVRYVGMDNVTVCSDYPHPQARYRMVERFNEANPSIEPGDRLSILGGLRWRPTYN